MGAGSGIKVTHKSFFKENTLWPGFGDNSQRTDSILNTGLLLIHALHALVGVGQPIS